MTPSESGRPRLLIVDDDSNTRATLDAALSLRYNLVWLSNGDEILKIIERQATQLLILDMSRDDGFETCERVRAQSELKDLPILFMTAGRDDAAFLRGLGSGGSSHIQKPFDLRTLEERIDYLLRSRI